MGFLSSLSRDLQGGTDAYKSFNELRNKWVTPYLASKGIVRNATPTGPVDSEGGGSSGMGVDLAYIEAERKAQAAWLDTLDPQTKAAALQEFAQHSDDMASINKYGSLATKALLGTIAGGAALTAGGVLGGSAGGTATGLAEGGLTGAEAGLGYGGYGGAGGTVAGQGGMLGGTSVASGSSVLGSLGTDLSTAVGGAGGTTVGSAVTSAAKAVSPFVSTLTGKAVGGTSAGGTVSGDQQDLSEAQIQAMADQLGFNREQFAYLKTLSDKQFQLGQDTFNWQRGLAEDARTRSNKYDALYDATTGHNLRQFTSEVDAYNAPAEGERRAGRAIADVESQLSNAREAQIRGLTSRGWNPNSAAVQMSMADMDLEGGLARASASTMAYEAARREGLNLRAQAAGLGQPNANIAGDSASQASRAANAGMDASNLGLSPSFTNLNSYNQGQNTAIGWGNSATSNFNSMRGLSTSPWYKNGNVGGAIGGGLSGYANNGWLGAVAGAAGGWLGG